MPDLITYLWLLLSLSGLVLVQRSFHFQVQRVLLLALRNQTLAFYSYAVLFFPGIALHELSHWIAARLLGVRVHSFSLLPSRVQGGVIRFGYVETGSTDPFRGTLIGLAPLLTGAAVLAIVGFRMLGLDGLGVSLLNGRVQEALEQALRLIATADLAFWTYLLLSVSNTMLPSASDRASWLAVLVAAVFVGGIVILAGFGPQVYGWASPWPQVVARALAGVFSLTAALDLLFLLPLWAAGRAISTLTGLDATR